LKVVADFSDPCDDGWADDAERVISSGFIEYFSLLKDPRSVKKTSHSLLEIIFTTVCAYICGANSWEGVLEFAKAREMWLKKYILLANGIPSLVTYWRTFAHLEPNAFEQCFRDWVFTLLGEVRHIAIDGKTLRDVYDKDNPEAQLVLVSAWATDKGLLLGQVKTDIKSNEITAIPKLLDLIRVKECLISIDAAGCQTKIAEKITKLGGEYLLALKGNQSKLRADVEGFFQDALDSDWEHLDYERCESVEKGHGRIDTRTVYLVRNMTDCIDEQQWPKIQSIIMVVSKRRVKDKETEESRYYITSSSMNVTEAALAVRRHWSIENGLHWSLDVGFREDRQVAQKMNLAENLAVLRRIAFTMLKNEKSLLSMENKRMKAAMSEDYLERVLELSSTKIS
jgi:predicted transposase YbfD/YdcC